MPEQFKSNDVAFGMAERGHRVDVWAGIPNYPEGRYKQGYGLFRRRNEHIDGVSIHRIFQFPRGRRGKAFGLACNYLSYALSGMIRALWKAATAPKYDAVFVHQTSPVTQALPAMLYCRLTKAKLYTWVLDLWPESLTAAAGIENRALLFPFERMAQRMYRLSERILISSQGFRQSICSKGDFGNKIVYFPNWAEEIFEQGLSDMVVPTMPEGFRVMFAGNIGQAQDFESIMKAVNELRDNKKIKFVIIGDGRKRQWAEEYARSNQLKNISFLGHYPLRNMPSMFAAADVMLVSLLPEKVFELTCPAKVQAYMASGKPIVAMIDGEGSNVIRGNKCGMSVRAGDWRALAMVIERLSEYSAQQLATMGRNGKEAYERRFAKSRAMDYLCGMFNGEPNE